MRLLQQRGVLDEAEVDALAEKEPLLAALSTVASAPRLLRNDSANNHHWLLVKLVGADNPDALGTRVTVITGDKRQVRERQSGGSYLSSHDPRLHFGLDTATRVDIEIRWPDGIVQRLDDIAADQILRIVQPAP